MREGTLVDEPQAEVARQEVRYRKHGLIRVDCRHKRSQPTEPSWPRPSERCDMEKYFPNLYSRDGCARLASHSHGICNFCDNWSFGVPCLSPCPIHNSSLKMGSYVMVKATFVALLIINALLWSQGSYSRIHPRHAPLFPNFRFSKRTSPGLLVSGQYDTYNEGPGEVCDQTH